MPSTRVSSLFVLFVFVVSVSCQVPDVKIEVFSPKGFRASIPDVNDLKLFVFRGNINRKINKSEPGTVVGEILEPENGRWVFDNPELSLKIGDVINYYVHVSLGNRGYIKDSLSFNVTKFDSTGKDQPSGCEPTTTQTQGNETGLCAGQVIFEDHFDSLREDYWLIENKIPVVHPEFPFNSYQKATVSVENGLLKIRPKLQQNMPGFNEDKIISGTLDLTSGCTGTILDSCRTSASGAFILPPVASGRVSNKRIAFRYGNVEIRAKLPIGDWVYPELLLEPLMYRYGTLNMMSGLIKVAGARGNKDLVSEEGQNLGNKVIYGGVIIDSKCRQLVSETVNSKNFGEDFHVFTAKWTPDDITFSVDGTVWSRYTPGPVGPENQLRLKCPSSTNSWPPGPKIRPFDNYFVLSLGVAVGGVSEFPDRSRSGQTPKPWRNVASKSRLTFWRDLNKWHPTWTDDTALLVDYVKITAL